MRHDVELLRLRTVQVVLSRREVHSQLLRLRIVQVAFPRLQVYSQVLRAVDVGEEHKILA